MTPAPAGRPWLVALALAAATAAVFAPAVRGGFVFWDDPGYVTENPEVLGGLGWGSAVWAVLTLDAGNWHPLTWVSLQLDATLFGTGPFGFHLTNVLLHAANAGLFFHVLRRATGSVRRSAAAALLWAVHPLRVESVAWVSERKDVLCGLFVLLTIAAYLRYAETGTRAWFYPTLAAAAAALMSKPMAVTLPCVLLLLDAWPLGRLRSARDLPRLVWEKTPLFLFAGVTAAATVFAQADSGSTRSLAERSLAVRAETALTGYAAYLRMTVWPTDLAALYPLGRVPWWEPAAGAVALAAGTLLAVAARRRAPYWAVGWFWFVGTTVPVSGLVQVGSQAYADRYMYLPHMGLAVAVVWGVAALMARCRVPVAARWAAAGAAVAGCVGLTEAQIPHWHSTREMWEQVVRVNPDVPTLRMALAHACLADGDDDNALYHADEAVRHSGGAWGLVERRGVLIVRVERHRGLRP